MKYSSNWKPEVKSNATEDYDAPDRTETKKIDEAIKIAKYAVSDAEHALHLAKQLLRIAERKEGGDEARIILSAAGRFREEIKSAIAALGIAR